MNTTPPTPPVPPTDPSMGVRPASPMPGPSEFSRTTPPPADLTPLLEALLRGETLSDEATARAFEMIMSGGTHEAEIGALLALLAIRTPTPAELLGAARVMRANVDAVPTRIEPDRIVDTAGTGGAPKTFNVSTVAAMIAAAAGRGTMVVAKHGNRSRTGRGSAEVLRQLGVNVDAGREIQAQCLDEIGLCFCFAVHHHPATRHVIAARKALGFATIFNLLGPLTNPAGAKRQVMGVYHGRFLRPIAEALAALGATRAMVVHSADGLDEITVTAPTHIAHVENGNVREEQITPEEFGLTRAALDDLRATSVDEAARIVESILSGEETGPKAEMAILSSAATLLVGGAAESLNDGIRKSRDAISSGAAHRTLRELVRLTTRYP